MSNCYGDSVTSKNSVFIPKMSGPIPQPPAFKHGFNGKVFTVPQYYPFEHSETQWILNMYRSLSWDRLQKVALLNPGYFRNSYFQLPDNPGEAYGKPMFHDRVIMYLTPFSLALYLNLDSIVTNLIHFRDPNGQRIFSIYQPCYVTNVFVNSSENFNDLLQIYSPCILILRQSFDCVRPMLTITKWSPLKPFSFLYRRPFKICKFSYKDIVDYTISQLSAKPSLKVPQMFNYMLASLSDEFALLYFEQIICQYHQYQLEEWVSIPRRLLRFAFYYDKEMRLTSQVIRCIQVYQQNSFFLGPTQTCFEINYRQRIRMLKTNFNRKLGDPEEARVVMDQDNCFSLLLALIQQASVFQHLITKDKLISIMPSLVNDTMWLLHFLTKRTSELSHYFSHLVEKVDCIAEFVFLQVKAAIMKNLTTKVIHISSLKDLNLRPNQTICVEDAILQFAHMHGRKLGHYDPKCLWFNSCNRLGSADGINDALTSCDTSDEEGLSKSISQHKSRPCIQKMSSRAQSISDDVIRLLQQDEDSSVSFA